MNIQKYLSFVKAVECGSFTDAAEILNYSQSGVSRMIADLEKEWGVVLLERSKNGVSLTSDGTKLLPYARELVEKYKQLQMQVDELNGLQSGLIRIGVFSSVATHWLPNIIKEFQNDYPSVDYELLLGDYTEIEKWITEGRVDCGFLRLPAKNDFDTVFLEQDEFMAVLPVNHPLAGLDKVPASALCSEPFILIEKGEKAEVSAIFECSGLKPNVRFTTWDDYAVMSMVESGLGISILPKLILRRIPYNIIVKPLEIPAYRNIGIAIKDKKNSSVAVKRFLNYLDYRNK